MNRPFGPYFLRPEEVIEDQIRIGEGPAQIGKFDKGLYWPGRVTGLEVLSNEGGRKGWINASSN